MKTYFFVILISISTLAFSQQVLQRITDIPSATIVELLSFRNGISLPNTIGTSNFNTSTSDGSGNIIIFNPSINSTYTKVFALNGATIHNNEQFGIGTFIFNNYQFGDNLNFIANNGSGDILPILILEENGNADPIQDSDTIIDLLSSKFYLPKTLTSGDPVPIGLIAICLSRSGKDNTNGSTISPSKRIGFAFNGIAWFSIANDPYGYPFDTLQEIDTNGQLLGVKEIENYLRTNIYPNPTFDYITLQTLQNFPTNFQYKIIDLFGRVLRIGNSKVNENIDVEYLANGSYIVQIKYENGQVFYQKFIKE